MVSEEEKRFMVYWEQNRLRKTRVLRQLYVGLPLATLLVIAIFINFFSGWNERAGLELRSQNRSLLIVLLAAALAIVAFIVIFSARHRWDRQEQMYRELQERMKKNL